MKNTKSSLSIGLAALFSLTNLSADEETLRQLSVRLSNIDPNLEVTGVEQTPIDSIFEVELNNQDYIYSTADGSYIFHGNLIGVSSTGFTNMTESRHERNRASFIESLDLSQTITFSGVPAEKSQDIYVFTDVSCGYCRAFHLHMEEINESGITVHYLAFPREGEDSAAGRIMREAWCSSDPADAITKALIDSPIPSITNVPAATLCQGPIEEHMSIAARFAVQGTPAIYDSKGRRLGGYLEPRELLSALQISH